MAKARSRAAARKLKDRWKAKKWYNILAPPAFDSVTVADTLTDNPEKLIDRVTGVSLQDLTNDFRKSHIVLYFKVYNVEENNAHTHFDGHTLTSDYLRRMIRRRRSKIEGVYDVSTRDGATIRVKPFATTDKRIQNSQKRVVRESMKKTLENEAKKSTLSEFVKNIIDGKMGSDIYKNCKKLYPVKRVEIYKTELVSQPTIEIEEKKKPEKKEEKTEEPKEKKKPKKTKKDKEEKTKETEDKKEDETEEEVPEIPKEEDVKEETKDDKAEKEESKEEKTKDPKEKKTKAKKKSTKKKTAKKTSKKSTAKKSTKKKTTKTTKKKAAKK